MEYGITATLGPGSNKAATWQEMLAAGATAFRLNTSHLTLAQLGPWLEAYAAFSTPLKTRPALVLDLQGSKWRLGRFSAADLRAGQIIDLVNAAESDQAQSLPVPHADFFEAAQTAGDEIVLNDARVRLKVEQRGLTALRCVVTLGGRISSNKGITFVQSSFRKEALSEKDKQIFEETRHFSFVQYAVSYIKDADEMARYRKLMGRQVYLVAKLERAGAVLDDSARIARLADEMWLCRGDLGAEMGMRGMARAALEFSRKVERCRVPVYLAGQVLEHMSEQPTPTRSEICYIYEALVRGYRGLVLSDETAVGRFPVESCRAAALFRGEGG